MGVRIIPAQMGRTAGTDGTSALREKKTRVAAYCRVSTELEEQESSFEAQVSHYTEFITANPAWEMAGIFADEGISGTGTRKRERFNAMIAACERGEIDMVITKSISRFARNTLDCLKYIRKLKALGIPILFEKENINTMDSSGEMLITIMASIAQQESQSISQNVRMGHQYRMQQGKPIVRGGFMGYRMSEDRSHIVIVPDEAVVVRRIFREFLEGRSCPEIARRLEADGVKSPSGKDHWHPSVVRSMLRNEKHMGDLLLQKYYVTDFITKKRVKNRGAFPKYYVENAHEPIVPKEIFMQVQGEFLRREHEREASGKRRCERSIPLYEKLVCAECGNVYQRFANARIGRVEWRCRTRIQKGTPCLGRIVLEKNVMAAVVEAFQKLPELKGQLLEQQKEIRESEEADEIRKAIADLNAQEDAIREEISEFAESGKLNGSEGTADGEAEAELEKMKAKLDAITEKKSDLMRRKAEFDCRSVQTDGLLALIDAMGEEPEKEHAAQEKKTNEKFGTFWGEVCRQLEKYPPACTETADFFERTSEVKRHGPVTAFDNDDVLRYVGKIVIHQDRMTVVFKEGTAIDISR